MKLTPALVWISVSLRASASQEVATADNRAHFDNTGYLAIVRMCPHLYSGRDAAVRFGECPRGNMRDEARDLPR